MRLKNLILALAALLLLASPTLAGYPNSVDGSQSVCNPQSPANCIKPVLISAGAALSAQSLASAYSLAPPAGTTAALIQPQGTNNGSGQCAFWRDDDTAPTSTTGEAIGAGQSLFYSFAPLANAQFIQASGATCTLTVFWYK